MTPFDLVRGWATNTAILVKVDHPLGEVRVWGGYGSLDHGNEEYLGAGHLGSITLPPDDSEVIAHDVELSLSGVEQQYLDGLKDPVAGRLAHAWRVILDDDFRVVDKQALPEIELSHQSYEIEASGLAKVTLHGVAGFYNLRLQSSAKVDAESHKAFLISVNTDPATDTGYSRVAKTSDVSFEWGPNGAA